MAESGLDRHERERLRRDFLPEAEEILDALSNDLRSLGRGLAEGPIAPSAVNAIFRRVHSLKGLAGMAGLQPIADLAHDLEDLLARLRMGRATLGQGALDLLDEAVEGLFRMVRRLGASGAPPDDAAPLRERLRSAGAARTEARGALPEGLTLDPEVRAALSEYEEHRLAESLHAGRDLALVRLRFPVEDFETGLKEALARLQEGFEVISTVPSLGEDPDGALRFALVVAGEPGSAGVLASRLAGLASRLERLSGGPSPEVPPASEAAAEPLESEEALKGFSTSLRVPVSRLDDLLAQVGDLSIAVAALERVAGRAREAHPDDRAVRDVERGVRALSARLRALQRGTIDARLVPLEQAFSRLGRLVARTARSSGKEVDLHTLGGETELDKAMMDLLVSPLVHLVANALDHGVEPPEERLAAGKPRRARLVLSAFQRGNRVVIDVSDDGRGISLEAVQAKARASGLLAADLALSREEAYEMIFAPGFSTAGRVSQVSGRGVGLDVVRRSVRALKGTIVARSVEGKGTTFTLNVPITLALVQALIVRSSGRRFAIPVASIRENVSIEGARLRRVGAKEIYDLPQGPLRLVRLERAIPDRRAGDAPGEPRYVVIAGPPGRSVGILIDGFVGQQEVVIKPVGRRLRDLPGLAGATDLGDATAVLVLDPEALGGGEIGGTSAL